MLVLVLSCFEDDDDDAVDGRALEDEFSEEDED